MIKNADDSSSLYIELRPDAAKKFARMTEGNIGKTMSLFYGNDKLIGKSTIQSSMGSKFQIRFPEKEGKELIDSLKNNQSE